MDKNEHIHEWNEDLECACGAKLCPPDLLERINKHDNAPENSPAPIPPLPPAPESKPAIQIIVELRKKIVDDIDAAMKEILELERKNKPYIWNSKPDTKNKP